MPAHDQIWFGAALTDDEELKSWCHDQAGYVVSPARIPGLPLPAWRVEPAGASHPVGVWMVELADGRVVFPGSDGEGLQDALEELDPAQGPTPEALVALAAPAIGAWKLLESLEAPHRTGDGWAARFVVEDHVGRCLLVEVAPPATVTTVLERAR